jgi:hypothetical protein
MAVRVVASHGQRLVNEQLPCADELGQDDIMQPWVYGARRKGLQPWCPGSSQA